MSGLLFGLSAALALILTNLDNLALMVALLARLSRARVLAAWMGAQAVVLLAALIVAAGVGTGAPAQAGYLGVVPILLGLWELFRRRGDARPRGVSASRLLALVLTFLSLSADSLSVIAPLLAEAAPGYRVAGLIGAGVAAVAMAMAGLLAAGLSQRLRAALERLAPWVMIAAGVYVLMNTATDMV